MPATSPAADRTATAVLVTAGWNTFVAFWVWLWIVMGRAQERRQAPDAEAVLPPDADGIASLARAAAGLGVLMLSVALWIVGAPQQLVGAVFRIDRRLSTLMFVVAGAGFAAFMTGGVRLALGSGTPMTREEIENINVPRGKRVRLFGPVEGVSGEHTFSFAQIADAARHGLWFRDPMWISVFLMMGGAACMVAGGFGAAMVLGDTSTRVVLGLIIIYGIIQAIVGARRGRRERAKAAVGEHDAGS